MSKEDIVILDSSNYIKGYRYELFCILKLSQTTQCVIFANTSFEDCLNFNNKRPDEEKYSKEVMDALNMRFEPPDPKNRWDSTLITLQTGDELPFEEISNVLFSQKAPPPNKSTLNKPLSDTNFLHDLDKTTQEIINYLLNLQLNGLAGDLVPIPGATEKVKLSRPVTLAELRKWRQQFLTYIKMHPPSNSTVKIPNMFVEYINNLIT
jgi:protein KTI12